jgi:hypothetical protein
MALRIYPGSHPRQQRDGSAANFEAAHAPHSKRHGRTFCRLTVRRISNSGGGMRRSMRPNVRGGIGNAPEQITPIPIDSRFGCGVALLSWSKRSALGEPGLKAKGKQVTVNKITWAQAGRVTEPGRYMFKFGWLTITSDDLAIWKAYPNGAFTLYSTVRTKQPETEDVTGEEFRLGTFELRQDPSPSDK